MFSPGYRCVMLHLCTSMSCYVIHLNTGHECYALLNSWIHVYYVIHLCTDVLCDHLGTGMLCYIFAQTCHVTHLCTGRSMLCFAKQLNTNMLCYTPVHRWVMCSPGYRYVMQHTCVQVCYCICVLWFTWLIFRYMATSCFCWMTVRI